MLSQGKLLRNVLILNMDKQLEDISATMYGKEVACLNTEQVYIVVIFMVKRLIETFVRNVGEKKYYYISTKFSKGSFLENNLVNLGIYEVLEGVLASKGQELSELKIVEEEYMGQQISFKETSKNFFEQCTNINMPAEALGIRYISQGNEQGKTNYIQEKSWLVKHDVKYEAQFIHVKTKYAYYDMDVVGRDKEIYKFHLFDLEMDNELSEEDKQIYISYFLAHSSIKVILQQMKEKHYDLRKMDRYAKIGTEGEYLAFVIPELIRILAYEKAIPMDEVLEIVRKVCGYETYSAMLRAVESCPSTYVEKLVPHLIEKMKGMN